MGNTPRIDINTMYNDLDDAVDQPDAIDKLDRFTFEVRKIKNGYIITRSWRERKQKDGAPASDDSSVIDCYDGWEYKNEEEYVAENPVHLGS